MKQVEFFKSTKVLDIKEQLNDFLASKKYDEVIDIQMIRRNVKYDDIDDIIIMVTFRDTELGNHRRDKE